MSFTYRFAYELLIDSAILCLPHMLTTSNIKGAFSVGAHFYVFIFECLDEKGLAAFRSFLKSKSFVTKLFTALLDLAVLYIHSFHIGHQL